MLKKLLPYEHTFFKLFNESAELLEEAAKQFHLMMTDLSRAQDHAHSIKELEKRGDKIARSTFELLHKTFITPFDRDHIHILASKLDDILDSTNRAAQRISLYKLTVLPKEIHQMAKITEQSAQELRAAIHHLNKMKNTDAILKHCDTVNKAESQAHEIALSGIARLFEEESDFKQLLKIKDIYNYSKSIIDECEDLANIVKGIVLEYA
ncbi:MAG: DUF47 domain-containing protein [Gammaproteobacteria bacterium]